MATLRLLIVALLAVALLGVPTLAAGQVVLHRTRWPTFLVPLIAIGVTLIASYLVFWAYFAAQWAGVVAVIAVYGASLAVIVVERREPPPPADADRSDLAWPVVITVAVLVLNLGIAFLWGGAISPFVTTSFRFRELTVDNQLPMMFADRLSAGLSPHHLYGDWLSSDRPPLQTAVILLARAPLSFIGISDTNGAFGASVVFQLIWVPGVWAISRVLGATKALATIATSMCAITGFAVLHGVFTWPKLGAAGLCVGAWAVLLAMPQDASRRWPWWAVAAGLSALAYLAHGGVMFSLLALAPFAVTSRLRIRIRDLAAVALVGIALLAPWSMYQRLYEPPGDRLLKWHLAGVIDVDDRSFTEALVDQYRAIGLREAIEYKGENVKQVLSGSYRDLLSLDASRHAAEARRNDEFFNFGRALGVGVFTLAFAAVALAIPRRRPTTVDIGDSARALVWCVLTVAVWCVLAFGPATTVVHVGSLAPLLALIAVPMLVVVDRWPRLASLLIAATGATFVTTWLPKAAAGTSPLDRFAGAMTAASGATLLGFIATAVRTHLRSRARQPAPDDLLLDDAAQHGVATVGNIDHR